MKKQNPFQSDIHISLEVEFERHTCIGANVEIPYDAPK